MRVCLTGTPGAGKTVLGRRLARFLAAEYVDVNKIIKQMIGSLILMRLENTPYFLVREFLPSCL